MISIITTLFLKPHIFCVFRLAAGHQGIDDSVLALVLPGPRTELESIILNKREVITL